jgi:hypothetical protein
MFVCKQALVKTAGKYVAAYALALALLVVAAALAGANDQAASTAEPRHQAEPYADTNHTPQARVSEVYSETPYGPERLRRFSPTERDAAPIQVLGERPLPPLVNPR